MTSVTEEKELSRFHEEEKKKKIAFCALTWLYCGVNCPKVGCAYHPGHEEALKEEPLWEGKSLVVDLIATTMFLLVCLISIYLVFLFIKQ